MTHSLQFLLLLCIVIVAAKVAGALATRVGQPSVFGEILAGLILGPTVLDVLGWGVFSEAAHGVDPASADLRATLHDLAAIGVLLLMFVAGLETDVARLRRVGGVAFSSAVGGVLLPLGGGCAAAVLFGLPLYWEAIFIGTILTATSVSISAQTLFELGALRSREGSTILAAAVIDDVLGILILSVVVALARSAAGRPDAAGLGLVFVRIAAYFAVAVLVGRWVAQVLRWGSRLRVSQGLLATAVALALLSAWAAEYVGGVAAITGAYVAGVLIAQTPYKGQIDVGIHPLTYSMFVPIFFVSIGLQANGRDLGGDALFAIVLVLVAIATKALGAGAGARLCGFTTAESVRVGVGMISRGEVGLIVASYGLGSGLITETVFSAAVVMVLVTTMLTPLLLRAVFPADGGAHILVEETVAGSAEEP